MLERRIPVKVSSDEAGAISLSPVRAREMSLGELLELVVSVTGKDPERVEAVLTRGTLVRSLSRIRWEPFAMGGELESALREVPEDCPTRQFDASQLRDVVVHSTGEAFVVAADVARKRRLFRNRSFLDSLVSDGADGLEYLRYDYDVRCDCYRLPGESTRDAWRYLADRALRRRFQQVLPEEVVLRTLRG